MVTKHAIALAGLLGFSSVLALCAPSRAAADANDPPSRVARLADAEGSVSFQPGGTEDWIAAPVNRPLTTGDKLWSDQDSRVELQLDGSFLRLSSNTAISFLNLADEVTQVQLSAGTLLVRVRQLADNETYEIDTPNLAFTILRPGLYRLSVDESGNSTVVRVSSGQGEVTGGGAAYTVRANETDVFSGTDQLTEDTQAGGAGGDAFDAWSASRDGRSDRSVSARYVSPDVIGYQDLDDQGSWSQTPGEGYVWFPRQVEAGWAPYHSGHWAYIAPWGYTWVDDAPWGFAPFHYGRWVSYNGAWGWVPGPRQPEGAVYVRPVYAPALVAWIGVGAGVAWFALGPREVYVPSYPVSRGYVRNINVSNTTVNTNVINNVYNTTIINNTKTVNVTNVTYVNRGVPGAVAATTSQAFTSAQPVSRNIVHVDPHAMATAPVRALVPAAVPTKQAVLGARAVVRIQPPAAVQTRAVVARSAPPPPPPSFERRQTAIASNAGKPLSIAQTQQIQPSAAPRAAAVRIAPPATPHIAAQPAARSNTPVAEPPRVDRPPAQPAVADSRPSAAQPAARSNTPAAEPPRVDRPPARPAVVDSRPSAPQAVQADRPPARPAVADSRPSAPQAVHPSELPVPPRPASPSVANSVLERQHLQEQQQLHAAQEQQRLQVQQQQELEHQQLAKAQADEARRQQLEQQHQQQTQALQQQHAQQQQQLQEKQQEQRRQMESQARPAAKPAAQPAEKPAEKPAAQPASKDRPPGHRT
jgi:FecR protein